MLTRQSSAASVNAARFVQMEKDISDKLVRFIEVFMYENHGEPFILGRVCSDGQILEKLVSENGVRAVFRNTDGREEKPFMFDLSVNRLLEVCQAIAGAGLK